MMLHVQQVEDNRNGRGVHDARKPKSFDQAGPTNGGKTNNFGVREQPRFIKGQQSYGNSNFQRSVAPRRGRPDPKKRNRGDGQCPRKECAMFGRAHSGECTHSTNAYFGCCKSAHMVRDCSGWR